VQDDNVTRLDARICKDDTATGPPLAATAAEALAFVRFVAAGNDFVAGGTLAGDDDADDVTDCTARPLHISACSFDICHSQIFTENIFVCNHIKEQ